MTSKARHGTEIQAFNGIAETRIALASDISAESVENLNQLLADLMTLRDLYKKHHWQVSGISFSQLHELYDRHHSEQESAVDAVAERIQSLGGVSLAMASDVAELTRIPRAPRGKEAVPAQLSRLLQAHELVLHYARTVARLADTKGDVGSADLLVGQVIRLNELQSWKLSQHLVHVHEPSTAST